MENKIREIFNAWGYQCEAGRELKALRCELDLKETDDIPPDWEQILVGFFQDDAIDEKMSILYI